MIAGGVSFSMQAIVCPRRRKDSKGNRVMNAKSGVIVRVHVVPLTGGPLDGSVRMLRTAPDEQAKTDPVLRVDAETRRRTGGLFSPRDERVELYRLTWLEGAWRYVYQQTIR